MDYVMYSNAFYRQDYLMHHGVKGMRWGVRRYQNEDGSLTDAGYKHYARRNKREYINNATLLAEKKLNDRKDELRKNYEDAKMTRSEYKKKRKEYRKEFRQERKDIRKTTNARKDYKQLHEDFKAMRNKAMSEIPSYKIKKGAHTANKILTSARFAGSSVYTLLGAASLASINPAFGIGYAVGGMIGNAIGSQVGYKVRNKVRRQFT